MNRDFPQDIIDKVRADFPPEQQEEILDVLSLYGEESYERERERVLRDLLKLAKGNKDEVYKLMDYAKRDYRDIICFAEYMRIP